MSLPGPPEQPAGPQQPHLLGQPREPDQLGRPGPPAGPDAGPPADAGQPAQAGQPADADQPARAARRDTRPSRPGRPGSILTLLDRRLSLAARPRPGFRYHGFISYSHAADGKLAPALQRGLQRFAKPWYRARALSIFRDNESLSASPHLWQSIQESLDDSEFFILLASPTAAASPWVVRETERWCATKPLESLLIGLTSGELRWDEQARDFDEEMTTALPPTLRKVFREEPRIVDLRWAHDAADLEISHPRFRDAVADLAAPLHHRPKEELASEEVRQHRRTIRIVRGVATVLVLLTAAAVIASVLALIARSAAVTAKRSAESSELSARSAADLSDDFDAAGLLSAEAYRFDPTLEARSAVVTALEQPTTAILRGNRGQVNSVAFSPDGALVASAGEDGTLRIFDVATRRELDKPVKVIGDVPAYPHSATRSGEATAVAFSPKGGLLACASVVYQFSAGGVGLASESSTISFWRVDGSSLQLVGKARDPGREVRQLEFSPDGKLLAAASDDGSVQLWSTASRKVVATPRASGQSPQATSISFSPDGESLAFVAGSQLGLFDVATDRATAVGSSLAASLVAFDPADGKVLAVVDGGVLELWNLATGEQLGTYNLSLTTSAASMAFSPDGGMISVALSDETPIELVDVGSDFQLGPAQPVAGADDLVSDVVFDSASAELATANADGTVRIFTVPGLSGLARTLPGSTFGSTMAVSGTTVAAVNGSAAVSGRTGVEVWDLSTGSHRLIATGAASGSAAALSPDGRLLAIGSGAGGVQLLDTATERSVGALAGPVARESVVALAFSPDGRVLAVADYEGSVRLFSVSSRKELGAAIPQPGHSSVAGTNEPEVVAFSPDGSLLAVGGSNGDIGLFDVASHERVGTPMATAGPVLYLAFDATGTRLASSGNDGTVRIFDVGTHHQTALLANDSSGGASGVAFSPNGSTVAAVVGCSLELWSPGSGASIGPPIDLHYVVGHGSPSPSSCLNLHTEIAFASNGALVLDLGSAGPIYVWSPLLEQTSKSALTSGICDVVDQNLSRSQYASLLPSEPYHATCGNR